MVGDFYSIVYEVVYIIRVTTATFGILYYGSLYQVVYIIPVSAYKSICLYEYPLHPFYLQLMNKPKKLVLHYTRKACQGKTL